MHIKDSIEFIPKEKRENKEKLLYLSLQQKLVYYDRQPVDLFIDLLFNHTIPLIQPDCGRGEVQNLYSFIPSQLTGDIPNMTC